MKGGKSPGRQASDTTRVRRSSQGAKTAPRAVPADRMRDTELPLSEKVARVGREARAAIDKGVKSLPVVGDIINKLDEVSSNMGRRR